MFGGFTMSKPSFSVRDITIAAVIAALYAALTLLFAPISYGPVQFRIAEAFTVLPVLLPQAVPGLALGCFAANLLGGASPWDVVFGTLATLLAALLTRRLRARLWLAAAMPVVCNAVIVALVLHFTLSDVLLWPTMLTVGLGEAAVVGALGVPLLLGLRRVPLLATLGAGGAEISAAVNKKSGTDVESTEENARERR